MATLTRTRTADGHANVLVASVPAPFSPEERAQIAALSSSRHVTSADTVPVRMSVQDDTTPLVDLSDAGQSEDARQAEPCAPSPRIQDLNPSVAFVQQTVLMTLTDLLITPDLHRPARLDRRHSMPADAASSSHPAAAQLPPSPLASPLKMIIASLRGHQDPSVMVQCVDTDDEGELLHELHARVESLAPSLDVQDAELAVTLVALLSHLHRLSKIGFTPSHNPSPDPEHTAFSGDIYDTLTRQLSELQSQRELAGDTLGPIPPVQAVERALLWTRLDEIFDTVFELCRQRARDLPLPQYSDLDDGDFEHPPQYERERKTSASTLNAPPLSNEKMRMDLDAVTTAIDRLYRVAPQLHNQRVELKSSKLQELERARHMEEDVIRQHSIKQQKRELEVMVDMIGRASERKLENQTVKLDGGLVERARRRTMQQREEFVGKLVERSGAGRMHSQDASFSPGKEKDPNTLLSLPEFIRELPPAPASAAADPSALLTFSEAIAELPAPTPTAAPSLLRRKSLKTLRSRSMSAPPLNWFLQRAVPDKPHTRPGSASGRKPPAELQVSYVAEYHENLHHVLVFLSVTNSTPGVNIEAESVAPDAASDAAHSALVLKCGSSGSPQLVLPARVLPGAHMVHVHNNHYEVNLPTAPDEGPAPEPLPLLDAAALRAARPGTFICASCSLPLVQSARVGAYDDLPSEHWAELVDAWMCHADQRLSADVARHARGFWPRPGQALVGGSYILFDSSDVTRANLWLADAPKPGEDWRSVRCKCGAFSGRCQDHVADDGRAAVVFRLAKYAIRPVSATAEPSRIPLSAFVVEDMVELAQAHATYRFIILDEEEDCPRLLLWLFKPNLRLSYRAQRQYFIPDQGTMQVAKVLYKIIGPSTTPKDLTALLNKYPGFPQAEYLMYPKDSCTRLAALLRESTRCYPESFQTMTGLDVGWLIRA